MLIIKYLAHQEIYEITTPLEYHIIVKSTFLDSYNTLLNICKDERFTINNIVIEMMFFENIDYYSRFNFKNLIIIIF